MKNQVFELRNEDLSNLQSQGGLSTVTYRKLFYNLETAKEFAETEYGDEINWKKLLSNAWISGDLGTVMYIINVKEIS